MSLYEFNCVRSGFEKFHCAKPESSKSKSNFKGVAADYIDKQEAELAKQFNSDHSPKVTHENVAEYEWLLNKLKQNS